jgi:hypothetical protein
MNAQIRMNLRRPLTWIGIIAPLAILIVWALSGWFAVSFYGSAGRQWGIRHGCFKDVTYHHSASGMPRRIGWTSEREISRRNREPFEYTLEWWIGLEKNPIFDVVSIPLWMPAGLLLALHLSSVLVRQYRMRFRKGNLCPRCNYDRTGLAAGAVCPECGRAST